MDEYPTNQTTEKAEPTKVPARTAGRRVICLSRERLYLTRSLLSEWGHLPKARATHGSSPEGHDTVITTQAGYLYFAE